MFTVTGNMRRLYTTYYVWLNLRILNPMQRKPKR